MKILNVKASDRSYDIIIENGIIDNIGEKIAEISKAQKVFVVSDTNVFKIYGERVIKELEECGFKVFSLEFIPGENSKNLEGACRLFEAFTEANMTRIDLVVALGGGVVGDLAGFAASTYLRGIPFVQVPTSLLAQVDSSIGGKTAVDLPEGKNLVGSFYNPIGVFIDPMCLNTLDDRFLSDGMAEVIKYGAAFDSKLFYSLSDNISMEEIIFNCLNIKKRIVEEDEKEKGNRILLNFGHTIGHALEKYYNYKKYTHGEAVAIGMYIITKNCEKLEITEAGTSESIKSLLMRYKLPYKENDIDKASLIDIIAKDKKRRGDKLNLVVLNEVGKSFIKNIDLNDVYKYI